MTDFTRAWAWVEREEGGNQNDPADLDGPGWTSRGITQGAFDQLRNSRGQDLHDVRQATEDEVRDTAMQYFWQPSRADWFSWPLSLAVFDNSFVMGVSHATMLLQAIVGTEIDGQLGPHTRMVAASYIPRVLAHDLIAARRGYHLKATIDKPTQARFLKGWLARCRKLDALVAKPLPSE